ncbi:MAG: thiamine phosphate synthase [Treponema sp.]|nr:thiamine phosphate synthase [Treponema sp.]
MKNFDTSLYFITDSSPYSEEEFLSRVEKALSGGATIIQLREKNRTSREYIHLAEKVHEISRSFNVPLVIDDRLDVALAVKSEGVHLGQSDMPIDRAREILGNDFIIGATTKTVDQAKEAWKNGADYCGVGAIYPTTTKVKTVLTSTQTLSEICQAVPIPVNAIGGLNKNNLSVLEGIKISGICVVSAIMHAEDPKKEAEILLKLSKELLAKRG